MNIFEEEFWSINESLNKLLTTTNANSVLLIDRAGQLITSAGDTQNLDVSSFSSLSAADFAATSQLATLIGEKEFSTLFHQGENENIFISIVAHRVILVIIFDNRSTLGLVRVRVKHTAEELGKIFQNIFLKIEGQTPPPTIDEGFAKEAEEEIDKLFG